MVTLTNTGNAPGTIINASLESTGVQISVGDEFLVATPLPVTVADMEGTQQVELVYAPDTEGVKQDRIFLSLAEDVR